jgi:hypothetical protein
MVQDFATNHMKHGESWLCLGKIHLLWQVMRKVRLSPAWQLLQRTSFEGPPENHHQTRSLWMVIPWYGSYTTSSQLLINPHTAVDLNLSANGHSWRIKKRKIRERIFREAHVYLSWGSHVKIVR